MVGLTSSSLREVVGAYWGVKGSRFCRNETGSEKGLRGLRGLEVWSEVGYEVGLEMGSDVRSEVGSEVKIV